MRCCELVFNNTRPIVNITDAWLLQRAVLSSLTFCLSCSPFFSSEASVMELRASLLSSPLPFSYAADLSILFLPFSLQGTASVSEREGSALFVHCCRHLSYLVCKRTYITSFYRRCAVMYTHTHTPTKESSARSISTALVFDSLLKETIHSKMKSHILLTRNPQWSRTLKETICFHAISKNLEKYHTIL